jgi:cysteine desulfurase
MLKFPIYLDYQATTPVDKRVLDTMLPYFIDKFGNAASKSHEFGWNAEQTVEFYRTKIARLIGSESKEIVFTSGATESNNLAVKGTAEFFSGTRKKIITAPTEHKSVLDSCAVLAKMGFEIFLLKVDRYGLIDLDELRNAIDDNTALVSIMIANNEIGTVQPVEEIGRICHEKEVLFHTDGTQGVGKIPVDVNKMNIDLMSFTAHKMYGPKGTGALFIRCRNPKVKLVPQIHGGGHEEGFRSGTLNVPGIVGFGKACEIALNELNDEYNSTKRLREKLFNGLQAQLEDIRLNGHPEHRLPNNLNISFKYAESGSLMMSMKDIAVSSGSACSTAAVAPSHVLKAIGLTDDELRSSIRFGIGRFTSDEEVEYAINKVSDSVKRIRGIFKHVLQKQS